MNTIPPYLQQLQSSSTDSHASMPTAAKTLVYAPIVEQSARAYDVPTHVNDSIAWPYYYGKLDLGHDEHSWRAPQESSFTTSGFYGNDEFNVARSQYNSSHGSNQALQRTSTQSYNNAATPTIIQPSPSSSVSLGYPPQDQITDHQALAIEEQSVSQQWQSAIPWLPDFPELGDVKSWNDLPQSAPVPPSNELLGMGHSLNRNVLLPLDAGNIPSVNPIDDGYGLAVSHLLGGGDTLPHHGAPTGDLQNQPPPGARGRSQRPPMKELSSHTSFICSRCMREVSVTSSETRKKRGFACSKCPRTYAHGTSLARHRRMVHAINNN